MAKAERAPKGAKTTKPPKLMKRFDEVTKAIDKAKPGRIWRPLYNAASYFALLGARAHAAAMIELAYGPRVERAEVPNVFEEGPIANLIAALGLPDVSRGEPRREDAPKGTPAARAAHWQTYALWWLVYGTPMHPDDDGPRTWQVAARLPSDGRARAELRERTEPLLSSPGRFYREKAAIVMAFLALADGDDASAAAQLAFMHENASQIEVVLCLPPLVKLLLSGVVARAIGATSEMIDEARAAIDAAVARDLAKQTPPPPTVIEAGFLAEYSQLYVEHRDGRPAGDPGFWSGPEEHAQGWSLRGGSLAIGTPDDTPTVEVRLALGPSKAPKGEPARELHVPFEIRGPIGVAGVSTNPEEWLAPPPGPYDVHVRFFAKRSKTKGIGAWKVLVDLLPATGA